MEKELLMPGVRLISGGLHRDARGEVQHINSFNFENVERFYTIRPTRAGDVRGWVGHRRDWKWFFVVRGVFRIGVVEPDDWTAPSRALAVRQFLLNEGKPQVLEVPAGHFAASMALSDSAVLMIFSSGMIEEASSDDYRLPADYWALTANEGGD